MLAVGTHVKIFPLLYALPAFLAMDNSYHIGGGCHGGGSGGQGRKTSLAALATRARIELVLSAGVGFVLLTGAMYWLYGYEYLWQAYLYHVTRRDHRHNFSPYFYMLYLTFGAEYSEELGLAVLMPQVDQCRSIQPTHITNVCIICSVNMHTRTHTHTSFFSLPR